MFVVVVDVVVASEIAVGVSFALLGPFGPLLEMLFVFKSLFWLLLLLSLLLLLLLQLQSSFFSALPVLFVKPGSSMWLRPSRPGAW